MSNLCFTGHRDFLKNKDNEYREMFKQKMLGLLLEYIKEKDVDTFYAGGASGFDNFAADCVLELKKEFPNIQLIEVLPFDRNNMIKKWDAQEQKLLLRICKYADEIIEDRGSDYYKDCYKKRNQYMVNHADYCIAWYDVI